MISCEFCEISKNTFFDSTPLVAACVKQQENHFSASQRKCSQHSFKVKCDLWFVIFLMKFGQQESEGFDYNKKYWKLQDFYGILANILTETVSRTLIFDL